VQVVATLKISHKNQSIKWVFPGILLSLKTHKSVISRPYTGYQSLHNWIRVINHTEMLIAHKQQLSN